MFSNSYLVYISETNLIHMTNEILAKSPSQGGILLTDHTKMVLNLGYSLAKNYPSYNDETLKELMVALILHDIGKCSKHYQDYMKKDVELDSEDLESPIKFNGPYHNSISWAFAIVCLNGVRPSIFKPYKHFPLLSSVLYHHTVKDDETLRAGDIITSIDEGDITVMKEFYMEMCKYVKNIFGIDILSSHDYTLVDEPSEIGYPLSDEKLFLDKKNCKTLGEYFNFTAISFIDRSILNYADRVVSSREYNNERILVNDVDYISSIHNDRLTRIPFKEDFSKYTDKKRLDIQIDTINKCFDNKEINTNVICASAGFGKTLMGLITYMKYQKKTLWVLPTLSLCESTYKSVIDELETLNASDQVSVGLFYSNEFKKGDVNSDIIIIGIDALLGRLSKNNLTPLLLDALNANVIFDEFHEFLMNEPLFAGFINLLKTRKDYTLANTFLLSATPLDFKNLWGNSHIKYWEDMPIYGGDIEVEIHYKEETTLDDMSFSFPENSITILPTVDAAQYAYINTPIETKLIHARYLPEDKKNHLDTVFNIYGKKSTVKYKTPIIGTNIIGTGFNISTRTINDYIITPMRTIQTIGRGSRFGEYSRVIYNVISSNMKADTGIRKLIESCACMSMRTQWVELLKDYDGKVITKNELYTIYNDFMKKYTKEWNMYISDCFKNSTDNLTKIRYVSGNYIKSDDDKLNRGYTYRGESTNFYATVPLDDGTYMDPIVCDINIRFKDDTDPKDRYYFMLSGSFNFPSKNELKYRWKIKKNYEATFDNCLGLARSKDCPLLLSNFNYKKDIGLYRRDL